MKEFKGNSEALLSIIDAQRKKMETPSKQPEISSMTHEEEEEMLHDISKLRDQVQQMSLSQKLAEAKINGVESKMNGMETKMNGVEAKMNGVETKMDSMEARWTAWKLRWAAWKLIWTAWKLRWMI